MITYINAIVVLMMIFMGVSSAFQINTLGDTEVGSLKADDVSTPSIPSLNALNVKINEVSREVAFW